MVYSASQFVNILPLLAYQKIYYDFFSESQWEKHLAYSYNVDYWDGKSQLNLAPEMLQLRYANYPKDYFMGMLPNSQYGDVAALPGLYNPQGTGNSVVSVGYPDVLQLRYANYPIDYFMGGFYSNVVAHGDFGLIKSRDITKIGRAHV